MMRLESGAPRSSKTYWAVIIVVMIGVSAWFAYDWRIGYAKENVKTARKILMDQGLLAETEALALTAEFTHQDFRELQAAEPRSPSQVRSRFAEPFTVRSDTGGKCVSASLLSPLFQRQVPVSSRASRH
ncbi:MAG: hypothetical protein IIA33_00345 [Planctomycetes bacterium]|nr:hypothetical protein [Planctomycetota bacterium]